MKSLQQQLDEKQLELRELRKKRGQSLEIQLTEAETELQQLRGTPRRTAGDESRISQELADSGLPAAAQERLKKRFAGKIDGLKEAIAEEKKYVRKVRAAGATSDSTQLVESYRGLGLSDREAKLAAGVETAIEGTAESRQRLTKAAKTLGMTESETADLLGAFGGSTRI